MKILKRFNDEIFRKKTPKVSIILVDGSFRESFHAVDFFCQQALPEDYFEVIWVEFFKNIDPRLKKKILEYSNFRIIKLKKRGTYHSSYCFNAGIKESRGDILFIADADVFGEKNFLEKALIEHYENHKLVMYFYRLEEPEEKHKKPISLEHLKRVCYLVNPGNYGTCLSIRKKWILEINGYEQHPILSTGFHGNGRDMYTRFKNLGLHICWNPTLVLYHPWHPFTRIYQKQYDTQREFTNWRFKNLQYMAINGLDKSKNIEPPESLREILDLCKEINNKK